MSNLAKLLGSRIAAFRKARNLSQTEFGTAAGISQVTLSQIENGLIETNVGIIERIAEQLGISPAELFRSESESPVTPDIITEIEQCSETDLEIVRTVLASLGKARNASLPAHEQGEQLREHRKRKTHQR